MTAVPTHVLIVHNWCGWGGGERYVHQTVVALIQEGVRVTLLSPNSRLIAEVRGLGGRALRQRLIVRQRRHRDVLIQLLLLPASLVMHALWFHRAGGITDVHIVTFEEQMMFTPLYRLLGARVTWSARGLPAVRNRLQRRLYLVSSRSAACITAVSSAVRESQLVLGVDGNRVLTVPNGVVVATAPRDRPVRRHAVVGFVGRLERVKDPDLFLDVAERMRGESLRFAIYGAGSLATEIERRITANAMHNTRLYGHVEDPQEIYDNIDLLLLTSHSEGMPRVVLEAAAASVPTITVDLLGLDELVIQGRTGLICHRSPQALSAAVQEIAGDPVRRRQMGEAARRHVLANFSLEQSTRRTVRVIRSRASGVGS